MSIVNIELANVHDISFEQPRRKDMSHKIAARSETVTGDAERCLKATVPIVAFGNTRAEALDRLLKILNTNGLSPVNYRVVE
jgi:hypothetical protein